MFGSSTVRTIQTVFEVQDRGTAQLEAAEQQGDELANTMDQTEQRLGAVTQAMTITGTAAVALGGSVALLNSRFARLDKQFATIRTTSGATAEQMDQVRDAAKGVSTALPVTLSQSIEAMKQLSFAGLSASESMAALSETSQLAVASNLQAGQAAQTVARSLNAFNLEARQTNAIVGALGQTFSSSATNISRLAQGLTEVQATANAAGLSVAETTASLGLLSSSGLAGSKAGTSLNATLRRLTSDSGETQKALSQLNLSMQDFTNSTGELRGVVPIMTTISSRMEEVSSEAQRIRIAQQLVGAEGARALLPLIDKTGELSSLVQNNLRAEIQGAIGDLEEMQESELARTGDALGMESLSADTGTTELIANLQRLDEQGESTEEITSRLQVGLGLTGDAAQLLAEDITQTNKSASELAESINDVTTASRLAEAQTETLSGQITQLRSDLQVIGYQMQQGTKPAVMGLVGGLRSLTTPLAQNESASRALGAGLVGLTGALGVATVLLGAHAAQLKLATLTQAGMASQTYVGTSALWAQAAATTAASKATWLLTASSTQLRNAMMLKTASLWFSVKAQYASVTATLANASAMGILGGAASFAAAGIGAVWTALGPIGLLVLGVTAAVVGLAGVMKTDLLGAGEEAGAVLGWFGDKAGVAWAATKQLLGILWELGRIGATLGGIALLAPFAAVLKLPDLIRSVGPRAKQAAAEVPPMILAGLDSMGPALYGIPFFGQLLMAHDLLTATGMWEDAGEQIPMMLAKGIARTSGIPVQEVMAMASDARDFLPFSPANRGPLQDLDKTGPALVSTIAEGVESERGQLSSTLQAMFEATPLGMAVGAASDAVGSARQSPRSAPKYEVTVDNDIYLEGSDGDTTSDVETAADRGTYSGLDAFFRRLDRENAGSGTGGQR